MLVAEFFRFWVLLLCLREVVVSEGLDREKVVWNVIVEGECTFNDIIFDILQVIFKNGLNEFKS
jgi:hypothetical protein